MKIYHPATRILVGFAGNVVVKCVCGGGVMTPHPWDTILKINIPLCFVAWQMKFNHHDVIKFNHTFYHQRYLDQSIDIDGTAAHMYMVLMHNKLGTWRYWSQNPWTQMISIKATCVCYISRCHSYSVLGLYFHLIALSYLGGATSIRSQPQAGSESWPINS